MIDLNYLAIVAATGAVFVVSSVYYIVFGRVLAPLSPAWADASRPPAWKIAKGARPHPGHRPCPGGAGRAPGDR
jgi:hypothetical protein